MWTFIFAIDRRELLLPLAGATLGRGWLAQILSAAQWTLNSLAVKVTLLHADAGGVTGRALVWIRGGPRRLDRRSGAAWVAVLIGWCW